MYEDWRVIMPHFTHIAQCCDQDLAGLVSHRGMKRIGPDTPVRLKIGGKPDSPRMRCLLKAHQLSIRHLRRATLIRKNEGEDGGG